MKIQNELWFHYNSHTQRESGRKVFYKE